MNNLKNLLAQLDHVFAHKCQIFIHGLARREVCENSTKRRARQHRRTGSRLVDLKLDQEVADGRHSDGEDLAAIQGDVGSLAVLLTWLAFDNLDESVPCTKEHLQNSKARHHVGL